MNNEDLERRLRTERGPREQDYVPTRLPASLDAASRRNPSRSGLLRAAVFIPAVVAGALAVAFASAVLTGGAPNLGSSGDGSPSLSASASQAQTDDCRPADLSLSAEPWGAAAGSRGTVVTIGLAPGRDACYLSSQLDATITDANGDVVIPSGSDIPGNAPVWLEPGSQLAVGISWSNWCDGQIARPVSLTIFSSSDVAFPVDVPSGVDPVPPCLGENQSSSLSVTKLQASE
jgi:hypothetical protein